MAGVNDIAQSAKQLGQDRQDALDALSGAGAGAKGLASGLADFFGRPDNLVALIICGIALVGIYRLLRSEHIIPAPSRSSGGSLLSSSLARSLIVRALIAVVLGALGLALATGRLASFF